MEKLLLEINNKFDNEFDFLQLLEVVYSKAENECKLVFLYPENVVEISQEQRQKLEGFLNEFLNLNAKLDIKFRKSFLDEELIEDFVIKFFKNNNYSLFITTKKDDFVIKKHLTEIVVTFFFEKAIYEYIEQNNVLEALKVELEKNFIAKFSLLLEIGEEKIDEAILEARKNIIKVPVSKPIARYEVFEPAKFFGGDVEPFPEFISDQKKERESVILAGKISNIVKKAYKSKFSKNPDEEKYLYTFDINDGTGTISAIHFANRNTFKKVEALADDMSLLFLGDLKKNTFGKLNYQVKSASLVVFKKEQALKAKEEFERVEFKALDTYQTIFPEKFVDTYQANLFDSRKYTSLITNNTIVVFDVETTGLEPEFAEIIEIGACKVVDGQIVESFQTLIKPKKEIPSIITEITGIDDEMVKDAPPIEKVMSDFMLFSKGAVLSGYNVGFDMRFMQKAAADLGFSFSNKVEDTMRFAREKLTLGNYTLKNVAKALGISLNGAHRALNDAVATARALVELNREWFGLL